MKKIITLISFVLIICFAVNTLGQTDSNKFSLTAKRGYIIIGGGWAKPLGIYGSTNLTNSNNFTNPNSGFAKPGICGFLEITLPFPKSYFGFVTNVQFDYNKINSNAIGSQLAFTWSDCDTFSTLNSAGYYLSTLLIGINFSFPLKKFAIQSSLLAGVSVLTVPSQSNFISYQMGLSYPSVIVSYTNYYGSLTSSAFAWSGNISGRYAISKQICLFFHLGIIQTSPKNSIMSNVNKFEQLIYTQPITLLNIIAGITYPLESL
jgi:hypothetical protein